MNALEALKMVGDNPTTKGATGTRVRPKAIETRDFENRVTFTDERDWWIEMFGGRFYRCKKDERFGEFPNISAHELLDSDGSPVEWEVVPA